MLRESDLRNYSLNFQESLYKMRSNSQAAVSIFLSHSHKDRDLVEGFINYLADFSMIKIYVDWQDSDMPSSTNRETATRIKKKIAEMNYFIVLATENALKSKWVPWEIGIADTIKFDKIAIVPVADSNGKFAGNEYLQLYPSIEPASLPSGQKAFAVFQPNTTGNGLVVRSWLSK